MQCTHFIVGDGCGVVNAAGESRLVSGEVRSMRKGLKKVATRKCFLVCCERVSSISNNWVAITENGKSGIELTAADLGAASGESCVVTAGARSAGAEFGPNLCRYELGAVVCFLEVTDDSNCILCRLKSAGSRDTGW